jgi:hypothetical protein
MVTGFPEFEMWGTLKVGVYFESVAMRAKKIKPLGSWT